MSKPIINKFRNGFTVGFIPEHGLGSVTIQLRGLAGSNYENKKQIGCAHIVEHLSIENSNKNKVLEVGGKIIGVTSRDDVLFMVRVLKKDFSLGIDYLFTLLNSYYFKEESFEVQKKIAIEEIKRFSSIPEKLIGRLSYKNCYPKSRLAEFNTGNLEDMKNLRLSDVLEFKKKYYKAGNFCLTVAGDLRPQQVISKCMSRFGLLPTSLRSATLQHKKDKRLRIKNYVSKYYEQTHLEISYYGYLSSESKKFSSEVLAKLFDNYLKNKVRAQKGYAYNINCGSFSSQTFGTFTIYAGLNKKNIRDIMEILKNIINNPQILINEKDIEIAKNQIISELIFNYEKTSYKTEYYSHLILLGFLKQTFDYELLSIEKVNESSLYEVFKEVFRQNPKITVLSDSDHTKVIKKLLPML